VTEYLIGNGVPKRWIELEDTTEKKGKWALYLTTIENVSCCRPISKVCPTRQKILHYLLFSTWVSCFDDQSTPVEGGSTFSHSSSPLPRLDLPLSMTFAYPEG
jgi:hypothetical protein